MEWSASSCIIYPFFVHSSGERDQLLESRPYQIISNRFRIQMKIVSSMQKVESQWKENELTWPSNDSAFTIKPIHRMWFESTSSIMEFLRFAILLTVFLLAASFIAADETHGNKTQTEAASVASGGKDTPTSSDGRNSLAMTLEKVVDVLKLFYAAFEVSGIVRCLVCGWACLRVVLSVGGLVCASTCLCVVLSVHCLVSAWFYLCVVLPVFCPVSLGV